VPAYSATPPLNAILVELRTITALLLNDMGSFAPDPQQIRADELWNITPGQGVM
jgi:hypothetical protein